MDSKDHCAKYSMKNDVKWFGLLELPVKPIKGGVTNSPSFLDINE